MKPALHNNKYYTAQIDMHEESTPYLNSHKFLMLVNMSNTTDKLFQHEHGICRDCVYV